MDGRSVPGDVTSVDPVKRYLKDIGTFSPRVVPFETEDFTALIEGTAMAFIQRIRPTLFLYDRRAGSGTIPGHQERCDDGYMRVGDTNSRTMVDGERCKNGGLLAAG